MGEVVKFEPQTLEPVEPSLQPASGELAERLGTLALLVADLSEAIHMEASGERDGNGDWNGDDPMPGLCLAIVKARVEYNKALSAQTEEK
jgi:hypothetical protein